MNRQVNLTKRVRTENGTRFCPVVTSANGRVKPDVALVNGKEERHPEGAYYIEWREHSKRVRISVGRNAADALARQRRKEAELNASNHGATVVPENDKRRSLTAAIAEYLEESRLSKMHRSYNAYKNALKYFGESCHKLYLDEVDRKEMLKFAAFLRGLTGKQKQGARSVYNKFEHVMSFLKWAGSTGIVGKNDWPRYVDEVPEIFEDDELEALFAACTNEQRTWYEFFLMTGEREQEVMHTYWSDVNLKAAVVRVTHKPELNWKPKACKEREIPIPAKLVERLKAWKSKADKKCPLLFPTSGCRPKFDFLDCLKALAERAELDPENCWLHKFRATFATRHLWNGVDLRTVQAWMGHSDLESTMRYLRPARSEQVRSKVDTTFA
jgi:integrase/recombinase XerD